MVRYATLCLALLGTVVLPGAEPNRDKVLGSLAAPVQIEVFSDFECPACKNFHERLLPVLMRDYVVPGKLCIIAREFPLNIPDHRFSRDVANFAQASTRVGKYQQVADALFQNQMTWHSNGQYWSVIASVLSPTEQKKVQALAKDPAVLGEVAGDVSAGNAVHINQTPTLIVRRGSRQYTFPGPGPDNYMLLKSLIDGLLK